MRNKSITTLGFSPEDYDQIDDRILEAMEGWHVEARHNGQDVDIPATWGYTIYPYKYFEVYKKEGDVNPGEQGFIETVDGSVRTSDENEIQLYLSCGWKGMDDEVVIVLLIQGYDVLSNRREVSAEIYRFGGDRMRVYKDDKLVTDFIEEKWWGLVKRNTHKAWVKNVL